MDVSISVMGLAACPEKQSSTLRPTRRQTGRREPADGLSHHGSRCDSRPTPVKPAQLPERLAQ